MTSPLLLLLLLLLLPTLFFLATEAPPPQPVESPLPPQLPAATNCSAEILSFSICLPYISTPPNNVTDLPSIQPSIQCCDDVVSAFMSNTAFCLCDLIQRPLLLGLQLNSTRLNYLTSLCPLPDHGTKSSLSLHSLCSGSDNSPAPPSGLIQSELDNSGDVWTEPDYETEPGSYDDESDYQENPEANCLGKSTAWKRNYNKCVFMILMLLTWLSM